MRDFILIFCIIFIFSACKSNSDNSISIFRAIDEGLEKSSKIISADNDRIYRLMEESLLDPKTRDGMKVWQPKAIKIKELSDSIVRYIEGLKEDLVNEAGPVKPEDKDALERNETVVDHVFQSHGKGKELFEKLINYRQGILSVDPKLNKQFKNDVVIFSRYFDQNIKEGDEFTKIFFYEKSAIAARTMLSQFENNIKGNESNLINFCNSQMCIMDIFYDSFTPLISLSSSCVKGGEEIEINAGVGAFTTAVQPRITINNTSIKVNENGLGIYKIKTQTKAGKYFVPINVDFIAEDGRKESFKKTISYTVIE